jgi:FeS assembly SUF system protein
MPEHRKSLNVLPTTGAVGKLDEIRRQEAAAPAGKKLNDESPIDRALDQSLTAEQRKVKERVVEALQTVYDPELPVNLYDLGLIYKLQLSPGEAGQIVDIDMTLTAPNCPVAEEIPQQVQEAASKVAGVERVNVELVWSPKWDKSRMSEVALLELGLL